MSMSGLSAILSALLAFYSANQALGLFVFLLVEEAGAPIWFLPGDALLIAAGATPGNTPATGLGLRLQPVTLTTRFCTFDKKRSSVWRR